MHPPTLQSLPGVADSLSSEDCKRRSSARFGWGGLARKEAPVASRFFGKSKDARQLSSREGASKDALWAMNDLAGFCSRNPPGVS